MDTERERERERESYYMLAILFLMEISLLWGLELETTISFCSNTTQHKFKYSKASSLHFNY
jgi:hypothetical protein